MIALQNSLPLDVKFQDINGIKKSEANFSKVLQAVATKYIQGTASSLGSP